jgi:chromosome segregation ATPase
MSVPTDPVAQAHRSRHGGRSASGRNRPTSLDARDASTVLHVGFLPPPEALAGKELPDLEDIRNEHEMHVSQVVRAGTAVHELSRKYQAEDDAHEEAIREAYANGESATVKDRRTPQQKRAQALADARTKCRLAQEAAEAWAADVLPELKEKVFPWQSAIAESQAGTRNRIEELNNELDVLKAALLRDQHLESWVKRLDAPTPGLMMAFSDLAAIPYVEPQPTSGPYGQIAQRLAMAARGLS